MIHFDDFPYAAIREAMGTVLGRLATVTLAIIFGSVLAIVTATESFRDATNCLIELPMIWFASCFSGHGFIVFPAIFVFTIAYVRLEWPHWPTWIIVVVMWWNAHGTLRWTLYDSPLVKKLDELQAPLLRAAPPSPAK